MAFLKFMTSPMGRGARIMLGLILIAVGQLVVQGLPGTIMSIVALIPISGGVFDFCLIGFVQGFPFKGSEAREKLAQE